MLCVFLFAGLLLLGLPGCIASTPPPAQAPQNEPSSLKVPFNILGAKGELLVNHDGELEKGIQITSADNNLSLSISGETRLLDTEGNPIKSIEVAINKNAFPQPENAYIVGQVYDFSPNGTAFNHPLRLNLKYSPDALQNAVRNLVVLGQHFEPYFLQTLNQPLQYAVGELLLVQAETNLGAACLPYVVLIAANVDLTPERLALADLENLLSTEPRLHPDARLAALSRLKLNAPGDVMELVQRAEAQLSLAVPPALKR